MNEYSNTVSILRCNEYDYEEVKEAIDETFNLLGGINQYIKPGMKVLLKINLLMKKKPEDATTTHPVFVEALTRAIQGAGGIVTIADSPGGPYNVNKLKGIYETCGIAEVAEKTGALLNYDTAYQEIYYANGKVSKSFKVIAPVLEADLVISVPKLKTHGMTIYTGAVKNLFGVIPGIYKAEYHFRLQDKIDFCDMLVDLCETVKPGLAIMDGIVGMEGSGPSGGTPRKIGAVIGSTSPYLTDIVAASMIGLRPSEVFTIKNSIERGLCSSSLTSINIVGDRFDDFLISDYKMPTGKTISFIGGLPAFIQKKINHYISPEPVFMHEKCIGCRDCEINCPPKAIEMRQNRPYVNLNKCIKCFCCQELCPQKAVVIKRPWWLRRLF